MNRRELQARFARAVEAEYATRAAAYREAGLDPETAHRRGLEDAKELGRKALAEVQRRGLFWYDVESPTRPDAETTGRRP